MGGHVAPVLKLQAVGKLKKLWTSLHAVRTISNMLWCFYKSTVLFRGNLSKISNAFEITSKIKHSTFRLRTAKSKSEKGKRQFKWRHCLFFFRNVDFISYFIVSFSSFTFFSQLIFHIVLVALLEVADKSQESRESRRIIIIILTNTPTLS